MSKRKGKQYPYIYIQIGTSETHKFGETEIEIHRLSVSKAGSEPGTSWPIGLMPVGAPGLAPKVQQETQRPRLRLQKRTTKWPKERDHIIQINHGFKPDKTKIPPPTSQQQILRNCLAAAIPANLDYGIIQPCLIWTASLNGGGYAEASRTRIHRLSYEISRKVELTRKEEIYHLCHRPYCVQPGHLYTGSPAQNALDREARIGSLTPDFPAGPAKSPEELLYAIHHAVQTESRAHINYHSTMTAISLQAAIYGWPIPDSTQLPLEQLEYELPLRCPGHEFRIPSFKDRVCSICGIFKSDT